MIAANKSEVSNRLSIQRAAELMGVSAQFLRVGIQEGKFPFGTAVKVTGRRYSYYISPARFTEFTGIPVTERS